MLRELLIPENYHSLLCPPQSDDHLVRIHLFFFCYLIITLVPTESVLVFYRIVGEPHLFYLWRFLCYEDQIVKSLSRMPAQVEILCVYAVVHAKLPSPLPFKITVKLGTWEMSILVSSSLHCWEKIKAVILIVEGAIYTIPDARNMIEHMIILHVISLLATHYHCVRITWWLRNIQYANIIRFSTKDRKC
jgi:hypothetical protein